MKEKIKDEDKYFIDDNNNIMQVKDIINRYYIKTERIYIIKDNDDEEIKNYVLYDTKEQLLYYINDNIVSYLFKLENSGYKQTDTILVCSVKSREEAIKILEKYVTDIKIIEETCLGKIYIIGI